MTRESVMEDADPAYDFAKLLLNLIPRRFKSLKAGLRERDIIVGLAGKTVSNVAELDSILIGYSAGNSLEVEFFRGDTSRRVTVTLGERPS